MMNDECWNIDKTRNDFVNHMCPINKTPEKNFVAYKKSFMVDTRGNVLTFGNQYIIINIGLCI